MGNIIIDFLNLRRVDKGTLYANRFTAIQVEHVATTYQLLSPRLV